ncbi:type 4a pilus biogenesis protein PilO [bacterium]|nr:type 4a pilus biogenesis protein PilO [bacterium]
MKDVLIQVGKLKTLYRFAIVAILAVAIVALYVMAVYMPFRANMMKMKDEYSRRSTEFTKMVVLARDRAQFMEEVESLDRELKVAMSILPDKKEIPSLLKRISEEAEKFGLEVNFFQPKGEMRKGFYAEVPVDIKLKGTFHEVLSFFDSINKLSRIVNVSNIKMASKPQKSAKKKKGVSNGVFSAFQPNKTELDVSFRATTYRFLVNAKPKGKGGKRAKK